MKNELTAKFTTILILSVVLLIPLWLVSNTIFDRQSYRDQAHAEIAADTAGEQTIAGIALVYPYKTPEQVTVEKDGIKTTVTNWNEHQLIVYPETLAISGSLKTEPRHRGIYTVNLYRSGLHFQGEINPQTAPLPEGSKMSKPYLTIGISDVRGITAQPRLRINDQILTLEPGSEVGGLPGGLHADLPDMHSNHLVFDLYLDLRGTQQLAFLPLGRSTTISMSGNWPSPSFSGRYLPLDNKVTSNGFSASWSTSYLSNNMGQLFEDCFIGNCESFHHNAFGVKLMTPIDVYAESARANKYGILFIALTFTAFFFFEMLKKLRIHPAQYLLVGVGLVMFFLLLLSLSEQISFMAAYAIAAGSCTSLLTYYIGHILKSWKRGMAFCALLTLKFTCLYGLLVSEDNALLLGTLLLFAVLTTIMIMTRKVDWYEIGAPTSAGTGSNAISIKS